MQSEQDLRDNGGRDGDRTYLERERRCGCGHVADGKQDSRKEEL